MVSRRRVRDGHVRNRGLGRCAPVCGVRRGVMRPTGRALTRDGRMLVGLVDFEYSVMMHCKADVLGD